MTTPHFQRVISLTEVEDKKLQDLIQKGYKIIDIFRKGLEIADKESQHES